MNFKEQESTPVFSALEAYAKEDITHFDVPGHKKRNSPELASAFGEKILKMDANSTPALDMLGNPTGVIAQSERLLADAFGADEAFMLVNGSTSGVQYMILTACRPSEKIIVPRNVHKSAINALIMSGAHPVFVAPEADLEYGITNGVKFENYKKAILENPDAKAVFVINPTYFGAASDLRSIVKLAHRHKMAVLVDEAHGGHFPFHPDLPVSAMEAGADMSAVSLHKTCGAFTQCSALLLNERHFRRSEVRAVINLFQTTSASYLLMSSIDIARSKLALRGDSIFGGLLPLLDESKRAINHTPGLSVLTREYIDGAGVYDYDETKIVVRVNELGLTGFEAYNLLKSDYNLQAELSDSYVVLCIASVGDDAATIARLTYAFSDISARFSGKRNPFTVPMDGILTKPKGVVNPRDAFYGNTRQVPIDSAAGEICADSIMIYPPGIPLAIPGEQLTREIIDYYKFYRAQGGIVVNDEENPGLIKILG
ncbi:MAG: aminotransferase class I/II-fold pyridoxal phosphate-dependent enzyme [Clostridia bacterium]|nr:aminotransferase class I/II-fold pyridoxal phosphate-dependent enzyme [Clostridia bacterium]